MVKLDRMKIYVGHASSFDYKNELYKPLREMNLEGVGSIFAKEKTNTSCVRQ